MATAGYIDTVSLHIKVNGIEGKRLTDWRKRLDVKSFLSGLAAQIGTSVVGNYDSGCLIEYEKGHGCKAYLHPLVASKYAEYLIAAKRKSSVIYVIQAEGTNYYKIGIAVDAYDRLASLQTANPHKLSLIKTIKAYDVNSKEKEIHKRLKDYHVRGEWFELTQEQLRRV